MRNPSLACEAVPHRILAVFPAAIMLKPVNDSAAFLVAAHHIQAFARWCRLLELNQPHVPRLPVPFYLVQISRPNLIGISAGSYTVLTTPGMIRIADLCLPYPDII